MNIYYTPFLMFLCFCLVIVSNFHLSIPKEQECGEEELTLMVLLQILWKLNKAFS